MSATVDPNNVKAALERTGCGWILRFEDRDAILQRTAREIDEFINEYENRFGETPDPFALVEDNPEKARAFFQAYTGSTISFDMRIMIWRVLMGAEIVALRFRYELDRSVELAVTIRYPGNRDVEEYRSDNLWDVRIMRHIGLLSVDGKPYLHGYFALRESK